MTESNDSDLFSELAWAQRLHAAGLLDEAAEICERVLAAAPTEGEAAHLLGRIELQRGALATAAVRLADAIVALSRATEAQAALVEALERMTGADRRSVAARLASRKGCDPAAGIRLAESLALAGCEDEALELLTQTSTAHPDAVAPRRRKAAILLRRGDAAQAAAECRSALAHRPEDPELLVLLSRALLAMGEAEAARETARRAIDLLPENADPALRRSAFVQLADAQRHCGDNAAQVETCRRLVRIDPGSVENRLVLARSLWLDRAYGEALAVLDEAVAAHPDDFGARWMQCIYTLLPIYRSMEEVAVHRRLYGERLEAVAELVRREGVGQLAAAETMIGDLTPFFLPYQGGGDRRLQAIYGDLVCRIMAGARPPRGGADPPPRQDGRLRIAFVSAFFWRHTVWKMMRGWLAHLDRTRFHIGGYHLGAVVDSMTEELAGYCETFVHLPNDFESALRRLRVDRPDIVVYPEIGMSGDVVRLAALRLAPVQCVSWGHPVTSGMPTIDYFLSGELIEPSDGDDHYTEKLVRLPGIGTVYEPIAYEHRDLPRTAFGLPEGRPLYLSAQSPQKHLPCDDDVFAQIAAKVPDAAFAIVSGAQIYDMNVLYERLAAAFRHRGLDPGRHLFVVPHMSFERFQALNAVADVFLDSLAWSGGNTTLEAVHHNLPVVTLPGRHMRARYSAGILRLIGVEETIARNKQEYVTIAVRLGRDHGWRQAVADRLGKRKSRLGTATETIEALGAFLQKAAETAARQ